jgi:hypothetical protein
MDFEQYKGKVIAKSEVVIERSPVENFARVLKLDDEIFFNPEEARLKGFSNIVVPLTYPFVMDFWGKFVELQPAFTPEISLGSILGPLIAKGGLILHGEQEFIYHKVLTVGDHLRGESIVKDIYQKPTRDKTMTFVVTQTAWVDLSGNPCVDVISNVIHVGS